MILANPSFVRAETKAWLFCAVEKDDVNIIKTFYDYKQPLQDFLAAVGAR